MIDVISMEQHTVRISDEKGDRDETVWRAVVANPELNEYRGLLAKVMKDRRGTGADALSRAGLASAVAACDGFAKTINPSRDNRRHFAMCLKGGGLTWAEADRIAGVDWVDRPGSARH